MRPARRGRRRSAALAVAGALLALPACAPSAGPGGSIDPIDSIERLGRKAAEGVAARAGAPGEGRCAEAGKSRTGSLRTTVAHASRTGPREPLATTRKSRADTSPVTPPVTPRSDELALRLTEC